MGNTAEEGRGTSSLPLRMLLVTGSHVSTPCLGMSCKRKGFA